MNQETKKVIPSSEVLLEKADMLEAAATLVHGKAYYPMQQAWRLFRRMVAVPNLLDGLQPGAFHEITKALRHYSDTVSQPARGRMTDAADILDNLC